MSADRRQHSGFADTPVGLDGMETERVDPRYASIDRASVAELAVLMNEADATVPLAVRAALPQIVPAIEAVAQRMRDGGRLLYVGAGTPGRLGVLDASECPPTFSTPPDLVRGLIAGGEPAVFTAQEGVEDDADAGRAVIAAEGVGPADSVVGVTASGRTPYVLAAIGEARARGALTVGMSCNAGTALSAAAEHAIEVVVGPEVVAGSTRLKAGTAQKLVLNMFSTIAMVQLGKTYGNLMVDLGATNAKLRERAVRMVRTVTGASRERAEEALEASGMRVTLAILRLERGLDADEASARLAAAGGRLRDVLEAT
ncbi:N-acetylmuramic acid 6-phosphate etherase [Pseudonocardia hierapolitana]|uniref:N-acetylmuramic acid 6-phosphate etherase n=1 Tax=Pseudonocardia hierapolitana TaxID=1128676 RepID=A0A561T3W1_9PSEU|nr:N-acetylmuramic acid 6-phosphate etherase [Pseudonocardia hierapolitana]TWF81800.1 N-acetylmuramic acid 6-phosphate etherase [Pseudonocardia hierapolitana]